MSISTPPPAPAAPKKEGMGCLGCGCALLGLIVLLIVALVVGGTYLGYTKAVSLTSATPASIPSFNGTDDFFASAKQKIAGFDHDVKNHQAATISLTADELNTLIARSPAVIEQKAQVYVSFQGSKARVQASVPTDAVSHGMVKNRFINVDASFGLTFQPDSKTVALDFNAVQIGSQVTPDNLLPTLQAEFNPVVNAELQKSPDFKTLVDQAKTLEIQNGELVIETK